MGKPFNVKLIFNKKNGQMNFSLPKKQLPKETLDKIFKNKKMKIKIEELYVD